MTWRKGIVGLSLGCGIAGTLYFGGPRPRPVVISDVKSRVLMEVLRDTRDIANDIDLGNSDLETVNDGREWSLTGAYSHENVSDDSEARRLTTEFRYRLTGRAFCFVHETGCMAFDNKQFLLTRTFSPVF